MIRVMVVDDSALFRQVLSDFLSKDPEIEEVVTAANGEIALKKLSRAKPDVITMDLEMPGIGGIETIRRIMADYPVPIVVISALAQAGAELTLRAMELGAVDVIEKPGGPRAARIAHMTDRLVDTVKNAAKAHLSRSEADACDQRPKKAAPTGHGKLPAGSIQRFEVVAIGASTGGPIALKEVLLGLPESFPVGILVVQHMPATFTAAYARRLDSLCPLEVKEASEGDEIKASRVLISPGDVHLKVAKARGGFSVVLDRSEEVNNHRPSVDVLMSSVAAAYNGKALAVIMTGMGKDGARGVADLRSRGGYVLTQDEASSTIYGMNRAVVENGNSDEVVALDAIAARLVRLTT